MSIFKKKNKNKQICLRMGLTERNQGWKREGEKPDSAILLRPCIQLCQKRDYLGMFQLRESKNSVLPRSG